MAQTNCSSAITVINPIRSQGLGHENDDLFKSLQAQWQVTAEYGIKATWLLQYGVLENRQMVDFIKTEMEGQEFGLWFEIDRNFAQKSGVGFRGQGPWYFSDGLFILSYDQTERKKLIDTAFAKFREEFGYYPQTVGAWWIGADSLTYMQEKYEVTATLRAADQYALDFYSIWGTPWSIPYVSSKNHQGIPAASFSDSTGVVNLQWAVRDPLQGFRDPLFSLQDFGMKKLPVDYVRYLFGIFLNRQCGNLVIGVENGGDLAVFNRYYRMMLKEAKKYETEEKAAITSAGDFSRNFLSRRMVFPDKPWFLATDFLTENQSFWFHSPNYRAAVHREGNTVYLVDLRDYSQKTGEDFFLFPNSQSHLRVDTPALVDDVRFPGQRRLLYEGDAKLEFKEVSGSVILSAGETVIADFSENKLMLYPRIEPETGYEFQSDTKTKHSFFPTVLTNTFALFGVNCGDNYIFDIQELPVLALSGFLRIFPLPEVACYARILPSLHLPYFPLDRSTYGQVGLVLAGIIILFVCCYILLWRRIRFSNPISKGLIIISFFSVSLIFLTLFSRTRYTLTRFEIEALEFIKSHGKKVVFVQQIDHGIKPIYRATRPVLYSWFRFGSLITGTGWEKVVRPEDNVIKLSGYEDKLIVVPWYLGAEISDYEIQTLNIKKIFDNNQISVYQKI